MQRVICGIRASLSPKTLIPLLNSLSSSHLPARHRHRVPDSDSDNRDPDRPPKLFVVQPRLRPDTLLKSKLDEALNLANSLQDQRDDDTPRESPEYVVVQNPAAKSARADRYFGKGTVETVKCHLNAGHSKDGFDAVFVNAILSGIQQRNLEQDWEKPVLDRVGLIIEIFNAHAQTKEGRLQAELAALMHNRSRLVRVRGPGGRYTFGSTGEVEVVSARGRGSGGRGFISGAGETELQLQRQRILQRRMQLLSEIKEVRRTRALQRASRKRHGSTDGKGMATVAVVGYTNAGKSTLVSSLSNSNLYCDDRLFATVDPKLRSVVLPSGRKVFLSDTVGFISELPVQLVEAFRATLEEVVEADLLVHVLDSSAPDINEHRETVMQVLEQLGVSEEKLGNMIEVWNKIDIGEEGMCIEFDEYSEEIEDGSYSGAEDNDVESEQLSEEDLGNECDDDDDDIECEQSHGDHVKTRIPVEDTECQTESVPYVKTSAITGVGLQELLELIDERLSNKDVVRRIDNQDLLNRKWRPPRTDETGITVEQ